MIRPQRSSSANWNFASSSGGAKETSCPLFSIAWRTEGLASASRISSLSRWTTGAGVFAGA